MTGTLNDARAWLRDTLAGDAPRANSLVKVGQSQRLLTSTGRRPKSPEIVLTDFACMVCMALMIEGPTKAHEVVGRLWKLPLALLTVDPGDGYEREVAVSSILESPKAWAEQLDPILVPYFGRVSVIHYGVVDNLIGLLTVLFDEFAPKSDFHRFDRIELEQAGGRAAFHITLHGPRYRDGTGYEGQEAHMVRLTFGDLHLGIVGTVRTKRTLCSEALNALAALSRERDAANA